MRHGNVVASIGPAAAAVPTSSRNSPIVSMETAAALRLVLTAKAGWCCHSSASLVGLVMLNHFVIALALLSIVPGHTSPVLAPGGGLYLMIALIRPGDDWYLILLRTALLAMVASTDGTQYSPRGMASVVPIGLFLVVLNDAHAIMASACFRIISSG